MLTGELPFKGETVGEVVSRILSEKPEMPRKINPSIPFELEAIVMRAINKDRDKRYRTAEDMERDIQNLVATRSFKKSTVNMTNPSRTGSTSPNLDKTLMTTKSTGNISSTGINNLNKDTSVRLTPVIIEKATPGVKILRTFLKLVAAIIIVHLSFGLISGIITDGIARDVQSLPDFMSVIIQGPYSQSVVEGKVATWAGIYSLIVVFAVLGISGYSLPIEASGVHRNENFSAEILPAIIVLVITTVYTFLFVARPDTMKEYFKAYNSDFGSVITNFDSITKQKGAVSYSAINDYKRKYSSFLIKKEVKPGVYDEPALQLKNIVFDGDHIKPNYISGVKEQDTVSLILQDLMYNVFVFPDPSKDLYTSKINQIAEIISEGNFNSIPPEASLKINKDISNRVINATFEWENNKLILTQSTANLSIADYKYVYPKSSEKIVTYSVENHTDKPVLYLQFLDDNTKNGEYIIQPQSKMDVNLREGIHEHVVILFAEKTSVPMGGSYFFNDGDVIKIDKVYYETPTYYSLVEKSFPEKQTQEYSKLDLKFQNIFITNDADIASFKRKSPK